MSANTTGDEYSRGRSVEDRQQRQPRVSPLYRPVIIVVWAVGLVLAIIPGMFSGFAFPQANILVVVTVHICLAGLVYQDIKSIRKQGVDWGYSRHLWFASTLVLPLVAPLYYLYSGRVVKRENERRKRKRGITEDGDAVDETEDADTSADAADTPVDAADIER